MQGEATDYLAAPRGTGNEWRKLMTPSSKNLLDLSSHLELDEINEEQWKEISRLRESLVPASHRGRQNAPLPREAISDSKRTS